MILLKLRFHHSGYLTDNKAYWDAYEIFSDNNGRGWTTASNSYHSIFTLYEIALKHASDEIIDHILDEMVDARCMLTQARSDLGL